MNELLQKEIFQNTLGDWIIAIAILIASFFFARLIYWVFGKIIIRTTKKTKTRLDDLFVNMLRPPVVFGLTIFGLWYGIHQLVFPESVNQLISAAYEVLIIITVTWLIVRLVDAIISEYLIPLAEKTESEMDDQLLPVLRKWLGVIIWIIGIIVALNNAGYNVSALLAGLGIGGLAIALAAKDTAANIFGGVTIFTDKPFKLNDRVKIDGYDGTISEIGIRTTRLRTLDGHLVTIPNSKFTAGMVENVSEEPSRKVVLKLGLVYDTPADKLEEAMQTLKVIAASNPNLEENSLTGFNEFGDSALGIVFIYYIKKGADILQTMTDMNLAIKKQFEDKGFEIAYPTQTFITKNA